MLMANFTYLVRAGKVEQTMDRPYLLKEGKRLRMKLKLKVTRVEVRNKERDNQQKYTEG